MSEAKLTFVVYSDDKVAVRVLSLLEDGGKVYSAHRLARGSKPPEGAINIVHTPTLDRYAKVLGTQGQYTVLVRESKKGMSDAYKKAIHEIPKLIAARGKIRAGVS
jgi:hypothetical protein